ncbi:hypothetical protein [Streptomyces gilvosporeus]|uniref:hypothetical protein n=1 Tax=Streptomyces gilvosporeus TaxID=553510 RepID=UPI003F4CBAD7
MDTALTLTTATAPQQASQHDTRPAPVQVAISWHHPVTQPHTGHLAITPGTPSGTPVHVWVDDTGQLVSAPETTIEPAGRAAESAGPVLLASVAAALAGSVLVHRRLGRRDEQAWAREWERVEPDWSGRRRHDADDW